MQSRVSSVSYTNARGGRFAGHTPTYRLFHQWLIRDAHSRTAGVRVESFICRLGSLFIQLRGLSIGSVATASCTFSKVAFTMVSVDSAMILTAVTLAVNDLGHSLSSCDASPREIGEREKASASMFRFPGTQRAVKLLSAILSRRGSSQGLSNEYSFRIGINGWWSRNWNFKAPLRIDGIASCPTMLLNILVQSWRILQSFEYAGNWSLLCLRSPLQ